MPTADGKRRFQCCRRHCPYSEPYPNHNGLALRSFLMEMICQGHVLREGDMARGQNQQYRRTVLVEKNRLADGNERRKFPRSSQDLRRILRRLLSTAGGTQIRATGRCRKANVAIFAKHAKPANLQRPIFFLRIKEVSQKGPFQQTNRWFQFLPQRRLEGHF